MILPCGVVSSEMIQGSDTFAGAEHSQLATKVQGYTLSTNNRAFPE